MLGTMLKILKSIRNSFLILIFLTPIFNVSFKNMISFQKKFLILETQIKSVYMERFIKNMEYEIVNKKDGHPDEELMKKSFRFELERNGDCGEEEN